MKINNTVEHDANSILEDFKNYYSTLAENLVNMLPEAANKYSINTVIKNVSKNSILAILKSTQVSKAAGLDSLSGHFLKDGAKFFVKPISDLRNLSINSEKVPDSCKVAKLR